MRSAWQTPQWRERRKQIIAIRNKCEWCGFDKDSSKLHIAHKDIRSNYNATYDKLIDEDIMVLCNRCHFAQHRGMNLCKCGNYKRRQYDCCFTCLPHSRRNEILERKLENDESEDFAGRTIYSKSPITLERTCK